MAAKNGSKATVQQVYDLVLGLEGKIEARLTAFEAETRRVVGGHSVELAVISEKQTANIVRMDGIDGRVANVRQDLDGHAEILSGKPPAVPGLVADVGAMKRTGAWIGRALFSLALSLLLAAGGFVWALLTHKIVLVEAAAELLNK